MFTKITIWMLKKVFNKNNEQLNVVIKDLYWKREKGDLIVKTDNNAIKKLYKKFRTENLVLETQIIRVKKGKRRYDMIIFETPEGKLKFRLGRHWESKGIIEQLIDANVIK